MRDKNIVAQLRIDLTNQNTILEAKQREIDDLQRSRIEASDAFDELSQQYLARAEKAETDLRINASILARQSDMARDAEAWAWEIEKGLRAIWSKCAATAEGQKTIGNYAAAIDWQQCADYARGIVEAKPVELVAIKEEREANAY